MMNRPASVGMLSVRDVARILRLHPNTVKRIPPRDLPYAMIGTRGDRRYLWLDVRAYVEERMRR